MPVRLCLPVLKHGIRWSIWHLDPTPDGFFEVILEANGRLMATCVIGPADNFGGNIYRYAHQCLVSQAIKRC